MIAFLIAGVALGPVLFDCQLQNLDMKARGAVSGETFRLAVLVEGDRTRWFDSSALTEGGAAGEGTWATKTMFVAKTDKAGDRFYKMAAGTQKDGSIKAALSMNGGSGQADELSHTYLGNCQRTDGDSAVSAFANLGKPQ